MEEKELAIRRIVPNINFGNLEGSKEFYQDFLGMKLAMDLKWILTFVSKGNPTAQISILQNDKDEKPDNSSISISIEVSNVDEMHRRAKKMDLNITYDITNESWGVRRFFVQDPNGATINLLSHSS